MTPERAARHKRQDVDRLCSCGGDCWACFLGMLGVRGGARRGGLAVECGSRAVACIFWYAAVVPQDFVLSDHEVRLVQIFLVETWRRHIIRWYSGGDLEQMARAQRRQLTDEGVVDNGHLLAPREQGGFWRRLRGKHTALGGEILANEGFYHKDNRLDQLERELNIRYNLGKHLLHWNRRTGKELGSQEEGWLQCLRCRRKRRWKDRITNTPWSRCMGGSGIASAGRRICQQTPLSRLSRTKYFPARCYPAVLFAEVPAGELTPRAGVG